MKKPTPLVDDKVAPEPNDMPLQARSDIFYGWKWSQDQVEANAKQFEEAKEKLKTAEFWYERSIDRLNSAIEFEHHMHEKFKQSIEDKN